MREVHVQEHNDSVSENQTKQKPHPPHTDYPYRPKGREQMEYGFLYYLIRSWFPSLVRGP